MEETTPKPEAVPSPAETAPEAPTGRTRAQRRRAAQRRRTHNVLLAGLFLLTILVFGGANLLVKDRAFSEAENRRLTQRPSLSAAALVDGSYFRQLTGWFDDQFFGRDRWIALNLRARTLLGAKESGGVFLGEDNYLLAAPEAPEEAALQRTIDAVNQFSTDNPDLSVRFLLVPDAAAVMPDRLPAHAVVRDQLADIAAVQSQLNGRIQLLDGVTPLQAHAGDYIFYRTDHHWTSLGAGYVFSENTGRLGLGASAGDYDVYTVATDFEGTLASKSGSHAVTDAIEIHSPSAVQYYVTYDGSDEKLCSIYQRAALDQKDKYTVFFGGNHPLVEIRTTADNGRSLLVFKDSFANCFMQYLVPYFEDIYMVDPRYYYDSLDAILNSGVTDVLYLYSADTFLRDTSLADVLTSGKSGE